MSFTKIIIAAALAVSAMAAPTSPLLAERATDGVVIATYVRRFIEHTFDNSYADTSQNLGGQGCTLNQGGSTSVFTIPISANNTCTPFSGFPPYQVKSAKTLSVTGNYNCKGEYPCSDVRGTPGPVSVCETANKYFGGVYILCNATPHH
ncbi:hypothetical protein LTR56_007039 [Elasticomyces elasticus]|nr:hypothetical protein LTR56_007039 [Elasticomyces elasticus]